MIEGRLLAGPQTLQVNLQNACNLNCTFCWNHSPIGPRPQPAWFRDRLSDAHLDNIIASLPRLRPDRLRLCGRGEPLLHPGAERLLAAGSDAGIATAIQTNALGAIAPARIVELGVHTLLINISGATPASYEAVHPGRGHLFERAVAWVEAIRAARGDAPTPRLTVTTILVPGNESDAVDAVALAGRIGADSVHIKGMEEGPGKGTLRLGPDRAAEVLPMLDRGRALAAETGIELDDAHARQVLEHGARSAEFTEHLANGPCYMGWYYLRVTCGGTVMFCCKDKPMGHLDDGSLYAIWRSPGYHYKRIAGRDGDVDAGLFDDKCKRCSNFTDNRRVATALARSTERAVG